MSVLRRVVKFAAVVCSTVTVLAARPAAAQVTWDWSFNGYTGQFVTDGSAPGNVAPAGTYNLLDWSVLSGPGATVGSLSGGQYTGNGFFTMEPYAMVWGGSAPTAWAHSGTNSFGWWVFNEVAQPNMFFFFGWETGNLNTVNQASYYDANQGCCGQASYTLTVSVASPTTATPEPASIALIASGLAGIVVVARRRRA